MKRARYFCLSILPACVALRLPTLPNSVLQGAIKLSKKRICHTHNNTTAATKIYKKIESSPPSLHTLVQASSSSSSGSKSKAFAPNGYNYMILSEAFSFCLANAVARCTALKSTCVPNGLVMAEEQVQHLVRMMPTLGFVAFAKKSK